MGVPRFLLENAGRKMQGVEIVELETITQ